MSVSNECIPYFEEADRVTGFCTSAVIGKRLVKISGARQANGEFSVAPNVLATTRYFGVAAYDAAISTRVEVIRQKGIILPVTAGADGITAGTELMSDTVGRVIPWVFATGNANVKVGAAVDSSVTTGDDVMMELY